MSSGIAPSASERIAGSFRDPSGFVFQQAGRVFRAVDETFYQSLNALIDNGLFSELIRDGLIVGTWVVDDQSLRRQLMQGHRSYTHFLEHELISQIIYPYEWTISMLADAGIHTLDLQIRLVQEGYSLKDASAYNVQFVNGRPTFIDVSSIEAPKRLDLWFALGQFGQMFTFPLLLARYHGWDLRSYFMANLGGRTVDEISRSFSLFERLRPRSVLDVTLPLFLKRVSDRRRGSGRGLLEQPTSNCEPQLANLRRLRRKIGRLAEGYKPRGIWSDYTSTCTYNSIAEEAKKSMVREFLNSTRPSRVLDLGCNTGDYSYVAAECGARVLAVDADHDAVEALYRRLRLGSADITPAVIDVANPSPAIGFRNQERDSFLRRLNVDCVLALALLHHLLVSANLSLLAIRDLFFDITNRHLILEYVPTDDPMFERLMKYRVNLFENLTLATCKLEFSRRFRLVKEQTIPGTKRTLLFFSK